MTNKEHAIATAKRVSEYEGSNWIGPGADPKPSIILPWYEIKNLANMYQYEVRHNLENTQTIKDWVRVHVDDWRAVLADRDHYRGIVAKLRKLAKEHDRHGRVLADDFIQAMGEELD